MSGVREVGAGVDWCGRNELHWLAAKGEEALLEGVVITREQLQVRDDDGDTPLHLAIHYRATILLERMLEVCQGEDLMIPNVAGETALHCAMTMRSVDTISNMLAMVDSADLEKDFGCGSVTEYVISNLRRREAFSAMIPFISDERLLEDHTNWNSLLQRIFSSLDPAFILPVLGRLDIDFLARLRLSGESTLLRHCATSVKLIEELLDIFSREPELLLEQFAPDESGVNALYAALNARNFNGALVLIDAMPREILAAHYPESGNCLHWLALSVTVSVQPDWADCDPGLPPWNEAVTVAQRILSALDEPEIIALNGAGQPPAHLAATFKLTWLLRLIMERLPLELRDIEDAKGTKVSDIAPLTWAP
eukprot:CAMPEP_0114625686 /NCGR_PEP_ID=MMETSP0168-20121206/11395_1 /TAXON_ID=95228 ORGANISM="Vannella sp., Strain DIVA3 517/6/12" /NCGR_SAMPLE_ID=MMETSP0168 /ASSEMBLY_ACC=CAM_ASM_000044 /LENGTH=365 /DNA_ID=CAMNT_0001836969 /DNA_START=147 /DNA_END=1241 /DNA_ORIENTATION=-